MRVTTQLLLGALAFSYSVVADNSDDPVNGNYDAHNQTTPQVREGDHTVHFVTVGKATNNYYPNSIIASPGDIVMFQFYPSNHSVIKAAYGYPCIPYDDMGLPGDMFYSGFWPTTSVSDNPPSWNLTINDTQPIFYYCGAPGSCNGWGMVGGINLNASTPLSNQIGLARESDFMLLPGEPWPNEAAQASIAALASTATTATFTVTETPESESSASPGASNNANDNNGNLNQSDSHHGLSSGAVAGIAVGSAIGTLAAVGLLWLMLRTRSLKKRLDEQQAAQNHSNQHGPMAAYGHTGNWPPHQSRHLSQLPPYKSQDSSADIYKPPYTEAFAPSDAPSRNMSPHQGSPYNMQGQQVMAFQPGDGRQNRYTTQSDFSSTVGPMVELDAPRSDMPEHNIRYQ